MGLLGSIGTIAGSFFGGAAGAAIGSAIGGALDGAVSEKKAAGQQAPAAQCAPQPKPDDKCGSSDVLKEVRALIGQLSKLIESLGKGYGNSGGCGKPQPCGQGNGSKGSDDRYDAILGQLKKLILNLKGSDCKGDDKPAPCKPVRCDHDSKPPKCDDRILPLPCPVPPHLPCKPVHFALEKAVDTLASCGNLALFGKH